MEDVTGNFDVLLDKAYRLFEFSEVKFRQNRNTLKWGLSLCATPVNPGKVVVLGISWGGAVSAGVSGYSIQRRFPTKEEFLEDYNVGGYPFIQKSKELISEFLQIKIEDVEFNYTNVCLFRSPNVSDLSIKEVRWCMPILKEFIELIDPPCILSLGTTNIVYLEPDLRELKKFTEAGTPHVGYSGILWGRPFYSVPHPNARKLTDDVRRKIWSSVFDIQSRVREGIS
jgi:uracil-DNA glycosylase family 4